LRCRNVTIQGTLDLDYVEVKFPLEFEGCHFDSPIHARAAKLRHLSFKASTLHGFRGLGLSVDGSVYFTKARLFLSHAVPEQFAQEQGEPDPSEPVNREEQTDNEVAITLSRAQIKGDLGFAGSKIYGLVSAMHLHAYHSINFKRAHVVTPNGKITAILLDRARVEGSLFFNSSAIRGTVKGIGLRVGESISFTGAKLAAAYPKGKGRAVLLDRAHIGGSLSFKSAHCSGVLKADGAHIGQTLSLSGAKSFDQTIGAEFLNIVKDIVDMACSGQDDEDTKVPTFLEGAIRFNRVEADCLDASDTKLGGVEEVQHSRFGILQLGKEELEPAAIDLQGTSVGVWEGKLFDSNNRKKARDWIVRCVTVESDRREDNGRSNEAATWNGLADAFERSGDPTTARRLRYRSECATTKTVGFPSRIPRWLYMLFVGYGLYPFVTLAWLVMIGVAAYIIAYQYPQAMTPTDASAALTQSADPGYVPAFATGLTPKTELKPGYPAFDSRVYALEVAIPAASIGRSPAWFPGNSPELQITVVFLKGLAWTVTAFLAASLSGLIRRRI
jgi:hypothetical protein